MLGDLEEVPTIEGVPVLLPGHIDKEYCLSSSGILHYHRDTRYTESWQLPWVSLVGKVEIQKHRRVSDDYLNRPSLAMFYIAVALEHPEWTVRCGKCPHHGLPVNKNGICAGHGLQFWPDGKLKLPDRVELVGVRAEPSKIAKKMSFLALEDGEIKGFKVMLGEETLATHDSEEYVTIRSGDTLNITCKWRP